MPQWPEWLRCTKARGELTSLLFGPGPCIVGLSVRARPSLASPAVQAESPPPVHAMRALVEPMLKPMYGSATVSSISPYVAAKPRT